MIEDDAKKGDAAIDEYKWVGFSSGYVD